MLQFGALVRSCFLYRCRSITLFPSPLMYTEPHFDIKNLAMCEKATFSFSPASIVILKHSTCNRVLISRLDTRICQLEELESGN